MKNKSMILVLAAAGMLALTACGSNQTDNVQTQAATQAAAQTETAAAEENTEAAAQTEAGEIPEDAEIEYFEGIVTDIQGNIATFTNDYGETMDVDISRAEREDDDNFMEGVYAEAAYVVLDGSDVPVAAELNVMMDIEQQADVEERDPVIAGTVQLCDINDLELIDYNGIERDFDNSMARTVSFGNIKLGDKVYVTYTGSILNPTTKDEDEEGGIEHPTVIKIVALDAVGSEEAEANYITGIVDQISTGHLVLLTEALNFDVSGPEHLFKDIDEEDYVRVYYEGALTGIAVDAVKIEKE